MNYPKMKETRTDTIILSDRVEMAWCNLNREYYTKAGYVYTKNMDKFMCLVRDLNPGSGKKVVVRCPICHEIREIIYSTLYLKGNSLCQWCANMIDLTGMRFGRLLAINPSVGYERGEGSWWTCLCECGKETSVRVNSLVSGKTRSCGCYSTEVKMSTIGALHPNWNHNLTEEERIIKRTYTEYRAWTKAVYERDNYTCQICGKVGGKFEAHHLYSYADYPDKQLDLDNGLTMCKNEHRAFHSWLGLHVPCTPIDLDRWMYETYDK